jgi:hypothetical protein
MATNIETSVAQVGLRDFLFYVLPGAILLLGLLALAGAGPADLKPDLDVTSSIAGVLVAYILGQCAYPLSYVVRCAMNGRGRLKKRDSKEAETFKAAYRAIAAGEELYFAVEVFRYRTMARFCAAMVFPLLLAGLGIAVGRWRLDALVRWGVALIALVTCAGFLWRYYRYECRYRSSVKNRPVGKPETRDITTSSAPADVMT